jgi:hypothetical protein
MIYTYLPGQFTVLDRNNKPVASGNFDPNNLIWHVECHGEKAEIQDPKFSDAFNWAMARVHDPTGSTVRIMAGIGPDPGPILQAGR